MRNAIAVCLALSFVAALASIFWLHVPWESVVTSGLVLLCLGWLVAVVTLPWNLYFQAKAVLFDMQRSRERGLEVRPDREQEAQRVQRRMLRFSVGMHLASAAVAAAVTAASGGRWGYLFSGFYLLSGFLRPAVEYYRYLRQRLGHLAAEVRFPRDDVQTLRVEVARLQGQADSSTRAEAELRKQLAELAKLSEARQLELERKLGSLARKFEETVDRLTDNQQIISGIKAFLRLLQQSPSVGSEPQAS
jgi:hypothetical protein